MNTITRAVRASLAAGYWSLHKDAPDRLRFALWRSTPPDFWDYVSEPTTRQPGGWLWRCPDPNFDWHYGVDDGGLAEDRLGAVAAVSAHWGLHHVNWNDIGEDHEAWDTLPSEREKS